MTCQNRFQNAPILAQNHTSVCLASQAVEQYIYRTLHCCAFSGNYRVILAKRAAALTRYDAKKKHVTKYFHMNMEFSGSWTGTTSSHVLEVA